MHRLCLAVCLCLAAALGPAATAAAAPDGSNRVQYKVLVFTKATAETARLDRGRAPRRSRRSASSTVRRAGDDKTDRFNDEDLASYRVIVFLNTSGDVLSDEQQARVRALVQEWRRLPRAPLGDRDRARLDVPERHPRHARDRTGRARRGDDQGRRPRARREPHAARALGALRPLLQLQLERARALPRARHRRRDDLHRRHDGIRPSVRLVQGHAGRARVLHGGRRHRRVVLRDGLPRAPRRRARLGRGDRGPGLLGLRRDRAGQLPAGEDLGAAEPERADRLRPAARRAPDPDHTRRPRTPARPGDRRGPT